MSYLKKLSIGTFHSFGSIIVVRILTVLSSAIVARLLGPTNLGILSIFQNIHSLFDSISQSGTPTSIVKYTAEYKRTNKIALEKFLSTAIISMFCMSLSLGILYFYFSDIIANKIYSEPIIALLIKISSITLVLSVIINFETSILQGLQQIKLLAVLGIINTVIGIPIGYLFIVKFGLVGAVFSSIICAVINILLNLNPIIKIFNSERIKLKFEIRKKYIFDLFKYSFPLFLATIILRPARLYGQTLLALTQDFMEVGLFKVAFTMYNLMGFIPAAISVPLMPMVSEINSLKTEKHSEIYSKILKIVILTVLPLSIGLVLLSKYIILLIYGEKYIDATLITNVLIISSFFGSITSLMENLLLGIGKTWQILYIDIWMALTFVLSSYFLIPGYGIMGLGMAWLIVDAMLLPYYIYYANKKSYINFSYLRIPLLLSIFFLFMSFFIQKYFDGIQFIFITIFYVLGILLIEYAILDTDEKIIIKLLIGKIYKK